MATRAERVLGIDPVGALQHLRLFGELLARHVAARFGAYAGADEMEVDRLRALSRHGIAENVLDPAAQPAPSRQPRRSRRCRQSGGA